MVSFRKRMVTSWRQFVLSAGISDSDQNPGAEITKAGMQKICDPC